MKKRITFAVLSLAALTLLMAATEPSNLPIVVPLLVFLLIFMLILSLLEIVRWLYRPGKSKPWLLASAVIASSITVTIALRSIGQLSWVDATLVNAFGVVCAWYVHRR